MQYSLKNEWYAIRVKTRHENIVECVLKNKNLSPVNLTYLEKSKRKDRKKVLKKSFFPGYMFLYTKLNKEAHLEVLKTQGVIEILSTSIGPISIPEIQINNILKLQNYSGKILNTHQFAKGMLVRVLKGPLEGLVGYIDEIQRNLLRLSMNHIPGSINIQVNPVYLEPLEKQNLMFDTLTQST